VLRFFHDKDFIDDQFLAGLVSEIHLLDGDFGVGCQGNGDIDRARSTRERERERERLRGRHLFWLCVH
jgi:hypothetical protein